MTEIHTSIPRIREVPTASSLESIKTYLDGSSLDVIASVMGYFKPDRAGLWVFQIFADGNAYFWIGDNARASYSFGRVTDSKLNHYGPVWINVQVQLNTDRFYPFRFLYVNLNGSPAAFKIGFIRPGETTISYDFTNLAFSPKYNSTNFVLPGDLTDIPSPIEQTSFASKMEPSGNGLQYFLWRGTTWNTLQTFTRPPTSSGSIGSLEGPQDVGIMGDCDGEHESAMVIGYFVPTVSGVWGIRGNIDDKGYIWIGEVARSGYSIGNALLSYETYGWRAKYFSATAGQYYPIRAVQGNSVICAQFRLEFSEPDKFAWSTRADLLRTFALGGYTSNGWTLPSS